MSSRTGERNGERKRLARIAFAALGLPAGREKARNLSEPFPLFSRRRDARVARLRFPILRAGNNTLPPDTRIVNPSVSPGSSRPLRPPAAPKTIDASGRSHPVSETRPESTHSRQPGIPPFCLERNQPQKMATARTCDSPSNTKGARPLTAWVQARHGARHGVWSAPGDSVEWSVRQSGHDRIADCA